jgi:hypothetical protein
MFTFQWLIRIVAAAKFEAGQYGAVGLIFAGRRGDDAVKRLVAHRQRS